MAEHVDADISNHFFTVLCVNASALDFASHKSFISIGRTCLSCDKFTVHINLAHDQNFSRFVRH